MTVDIEKLRALHAATTQWPWEADGHSVWSSDRVANCGIDPDIDDGECIANAAFIAAVHGSVLPLCDEVERLRRDLASADERFEAVRADRDAKYRDNEKGYKALRDLGLEADRLRAENARLAGELKEVRSNLAEHISASAELAEVAGRLVPDLCNEVFMLRAKVTP